MSKAMIAFCPYCGNKDVGIKFKWSEDKDWDKNIKDYDRYICYNCGNIFRVILLKQFSDRVSDDD